MAIDYRTLLSDMKSDFSSSSALNNATSSTDWDAITSWLGKLYLLKGVPFHYLVPNIAMLPKESIRYFAIDDNWVKALVDGAYSIGRTAFQTAPSLSEWLEIQLYTNTDTTNNIESAYQQQALTERAKKLNLTPSTTPITNMTGFILRSQVVSDFKHLQVEGYNNTNYPNLPDAPGTSLPLIRLERLSEDIMIGIFSGTLYQLDFKQPSEGLHFGFDSVTASDTTVTAFSKDLRYIKGDQAGSEAIGQSFSESTPSQSVFRDFNAVPTSNYQPKGSVINMYQFSQSMASTLTSSNIPYNCNTLAEKTPTPINLTSADFALQFTEGVSKVSFIFPTSH